MAKKSHPHKNVDGAFSSALIAVAAGQANKENDEEDRTDVLTSSALCAQLGAKMICEEGSAAIQDQKVSALEAALRQTRRERDLYGCALSDLVEAMQILTKQMRRAISKEGNEKKTTSTHGEEDIEIQELETGLMRFSDMNLDETGILEYPSSAYQVGVAFISFNRACQMLQDNMQIASIECVAAVEDLNQTHDYVEITQECNLKLKTLLKTSQGKNASLRRDLRQAQRHKKVLAKEVRRLEQLRLTTESQTKAMSKDIENMRFLLYDRQLRATHERADNDVSNQRENRCADDVLKQASVSLILANSKIGQEHCHTHD